MNLRTENMFRMFLASGKILLCGLAAGLFLQPATGMQNESRRASMASVTERALNFEANYGQYASGVSFVSRGPNYYLDLSPSQVRVTLRKVAGGRGAQSPQQIKRAPTSIDFRTLLVELPGANPQARMTGEGEISGRANYFIGKDPALWRTSVPTFNRVRVTDVYPGITLIHYGNDHRLEYDFEIAPNANPADIALRFTGADKIEINADGELVLTLGSEEIRQPKPVIYQIVNGRRKTIFGEYRLADAATVRFSVGKYDQTRVLVIDPIVSYGDYVLGANGASDDNVWAVATGADGSIYMAGETLTAGSATTNAYQTNLAGVVGGHGDVFVTRQDNEALSKVYLTYLGGTSYESALALAVDSAGNAYVTGYTGSTNFPTKNAVQSNIAGIPPAGFASPAADCFVTKIGPYGSNLVFSTYYGGSGSGLNGEGDEVGYGLALDSNQNVYVAGYTTSTNFPALNTTFTNTSGFADGFVFKLDASGTNVIYAMLLGGTNNDFARDIVVDPSGNPVVTGYTASTNFPITTNAIQVRLNNTTNSSTASDAFICKLGATSGTLTYSTFLGGTNAEQGIRLATDVNGAAYVVGWTASGDFPHTSTNFSSAVISNSTYADVFVVKLDPNNTNFDYAITFGGTGKDEGWDIAVDDAGRAHVVGATESQNFPTNLFFGSIYGPLYLSDKISGASDAFISVINSNGTAFEYSAYFGTAGIDLGFGVALDAGGNSYYVGEIGVGPSGSKDAFILKILAETSPVPLAIASSGTNVLLSWPGYAPELSLESRTNILGTNAWSSVAASKVLTNNNYLVTLPSTNAVDFFRLKR